MVGEFSYDFTRTSSNRATIFLRGALNSANVGSVENEIDEFIATLANPVHVLFDFNDVTRCDLGARQTLVRVQQKLGARGCRSAFLASRPRIRGVTLWIVHTSEDGMARPVVNMDEAEDWLAGGVETRLDNVITHASRTTEIAVRGMKARNRGAM